MVVGLRLYPSSDMLMIRKLVKLQGSFARFFSSSSSGTNCPPVHLSFFAKSKQQNRVAVSTSGITLSSTSVSKGSPLS
ncbi:hypothetical protein U1Q18_000065, partial [Sarracenia purpurea var. burkii]